MRVAAIAVVAVTAKLTLHNVDVDDTKGPLSRREVAAVSNALGSALGVLSGNQAAGSIYSSCVSMYPKGKKTPAQEKTGAVWASCQGFFH
mmetsp:Transcript_48937/g.110898  ORF Transcript_48937/g.110898 Transcript_48937/m.110898 type:complete len:90 (+) Transcript_48937:95-364(+)